MDLVTRLLHDNGLPTADLKSHDNARFFACETAGGSAVAGLEPYADVALLRSVVVEPGARNRGLATALVGHVEAYATANGIGRLYLLTDTAERFFERLGYRRVPRAQAPPAIRATREFASLCPDHAAFMSKSLAPGVRPR